MKKIKAPASILLETIAAQLAATFYEIGRSQGLKSIHKDYKSYVKANILRFMPRAVEYCLDMLNNPHTPADQKALIFEALKERVNDPENDCVMLPDIDIKTLLPKQEPKPVIINTEKKPLNIKDMPLIRTN